jgi:hypothetical protein
MQIFGLLRKVVDSYKLHLLVELEIPALKRVDHDPRVVADFQLT